MWNKDWKKGIDYPSWGDTDVYKKTIAEGYLVNNLLYFVIMFCYCFVSKLFQNSLKIILGVKSIIVL